MTDQTVMVPVLVSAAVSVEVMVNVPVDAGVPDPPTWPSVHTALAYVMPEGFRVEDITDWERLPT